MTRYLCQIAILALATTSLLLPGNTASANGNTVPVLNISGLVVDRSPALPFFSTPVTNLRQKVDALNRAATDDDVAAVLVRYEMPMWTYAQSSEFQEAIVTFRNSGKPVYVHYDAGTIIDYIAATPATHVSMSPVGVVDLAGLGFSLYYFKETLAKLGMEAEAIQTGAYKNAFEPFTESSMTAETREQMNDLLDDLFGHAVSSLSRHRELDEELATDLLTGGPYTSTRAVELNLIDSMLHLPDLRTHMEEEVGRELSFDSRYATPRRQAPRMPSMADLFGGGFGRRSTPPAAPTNIALVYAQGPIIDGRSGEFNPFIIEQAVASEDFLEILDDISKDNSIRAIVIRVDSPGGSAIASDRIHNALADIRHKGTPIVVSMGSMAASGGYYIAMEADKILAQPTTLTGSIGVVGGKLSMEGTFNSIGIHREHLHRGENTELYSTARRWTDRERALLGEIIDEIYETFTTKAANARNMDHDALLELAGGRVYTGTRALDVGLIDELGGLSRAIAVARELADAPDARVVVYPKEPTLLEMLENLFSSGITMNMGRGFQGDMQILLQAAELILPREARNTIGFLLQIRENTATPLAFMPWVIEIR
ncbi:MAG: signal peptide peptidase SppA [Candidatus Sumerlaeia bacterium]|nr:signal peptide peptidase SppA [Candidatus Sumerlaeia bacterium]